MTIELTTEQEAFFNEVAAHEGKSADQLLTDFALELLQDRTRFRAEVDEGLRAAERGEFLEEDAMHARIEAMFAR